MKFSKEIEASIKKIKGSGFWSMATEKRLRDIVTTLINSNVKDEIVADVIGNFWNCVAGEYGE